MFRSLALAVAATALTAASAQAQSPYKLGVDLLSGPNGAYVQSVVLGSVADQIGFRSGDTIFGVNGRATNDPFVIRNAVFGGNNVSLNVQRGFDLYRIDISFAPAIGNGPPVPVAQMVRVKK